MGKLQKQKALLIGLPEAPAVQPEIKRAGVLNRSTPQVNEAPKTAKEAPVATNTNRARTAPGTMLGFMSAQSEAIKEAEALRAQLKEFDGATPVRELDPHSIVRSKWANRHEASFENAEFEALKAEIEQAGGNVQPIKVRPKSGQPGVYELIFGHRRHQACLQLGLQVRALIEETSEQELFEQMERENRGRANLSAWEQGCMYRQAIDDGLYSSMRKLSESVGVDLSLVSKSIALARLPGEVVAAFPSPLDIQFRWAQSLSEVQQKDPEALLQRARVLKAMDPRPASSKVFAVLVGAEVWNGSTPEKRSDQFIQRDGKRIAALSVDAKGRALVRFEAGALPESKHRELLKLIENFLN